MRTHGIVVETLGFNRGLGIGEVEKPVLIQAPITEATAETLDERMLGGPARFDRGERDAVLIRSLIHGFAAKATIVRRCSGVTTSFPAGLSPPGDSAFGRPRAA